MGPDQPEDKRRCLWFIHAPRTSRCCCGSASTLGLPRCLHTDTKWHLYARRERTSTKHSALGRHASPGLTASLSLRLRQCRHSKGRPARQCPCRCWLWVCNFGSWAWQCSCLCRPFARSSFFHRRHGRQRSRQTKSVALRGILQRQLAAGAADRAAGALTWTA